MSWTNISNEEGGTSIRTKINNAMNALFGELPITQFWQEVSGQGRIEPTDSMGVQAPDVVTDELTVVDLAFGGPVGTAKPLFVDPDGKVKTQNNKMGIISSGTSSTLSDIFDVVYVKSENNYVLTLPDAASNMDREVLIRKASSESYELSIEKNLGDILTFTDASLASFGIKATAAGAWVKIKAYQQGLATGWAVIMHSNDFSSYI